MDKFKLWMGIAIIAIMVLSTAGVVFNYAVGEGNAVSYNTTVFTVSSTGAGITAKIGGQKLRFDYLPQQVQGITADSAAFQRIKSTLMVQMTSDYNSTSSDFIAQAEFNLAQVLETHFKIYSAAGFTWKTNTTAPVITCANATAYVPVIRFIDSNETKIRMDGNCVLVEASSGNDFIAAKDRLLYGLLGVMG